MLAPSSASPETAGMSTAALARVDQHLKQRYIDAGRYPGAHDVRAAAAEDGRVARRAEQRVDRERERVKLHVS